MGRQEKYLGRLLMDFYCYRSALSALKLSDVTQIIKLTMKRGIRGFIHRQLVCTMLYTAKKKTYSAAAPQRHFQQTSRRNTMKSLSEDCDKVNCSHWFYHVRCCWTEKHLPVKSHDIVSDAHRFMGLTWDGGLILTKDEALTCCEVQWNVIPW